MELTNKILIDNITHKEWKITAQSENGISVQDNNGTECFLSITALEDGFKCNTFCIKSEKDENEQIKPDYYDFRTKHCSDVQKNFLSRNGMIAFYEGNVLKYLYRYPKKNNIEDLKKARTYLNMLIDLIIDEGI